MHVQDRNGKRLLRGSIVQPEDYSDGVQLCCVSIDTHNIALNSLVPGDLNINIPTYSFVETKWVVIGFKKLEERNES